MKKSSLKTNIIFQIVYEVLILFLPFIISPYISRIIGSEGLGIYSYSYSIAYYFVLFSMLGIKTYGNRAIAQVRNDQESLNKKFSELLMIHVAASIFFTVIYIIYSIFINQDNKLFFLIQGLYVISAIFDISWFYFGIEKFKLTIARNTFIKIFTLILIFMFVKDKNDAIIYCLIMSGSSLLSQIVLWIPLKRYVKICRVNIQNIIIHLKPMTILLLPTIAVSLYKYMDKIMLGLISNKSQVGFYQNAEQLIAIPGAVIGAIGVVMLPKMANLVAEKKSNDIKKYMDLSMRYFMFISIGMACGLAGISKVFSPMFWGSEFTYCGILILWLAITVPFVTFANIIRTQYLIPNSKDKEYVISVSGGAILNVVSNLIFIPKFNSLGAVFGTILAEATVCIIQCIYAHHELKIKKYIIDIIPYLFFGLCMFGCVYGIGFIKCPSIVTILIQISVGTIIYIIPCAIYLYKIDDHVVKIIINKIRSKVL